MARHTSMKDVAARAGVHSSTVSLCLNNSPLVAEKTRLKVLKATKEIGYRPNPFVATLMRNRRRGRLPAAPPILAFVTTFPTRDGWRKRFPRMNHAFAAAKQQAESRGFRLEEFWAPLNQLSPRRLSDILYSRNITGILLAPFPRQLDRYDLQWDRFAVVALGVSLRDPRVHHVRSNHFKSMLRVMDACRELGYRRIGLALKEEANRRMEQRWLAAYLVKQNEFGLPDPPKALLAEDWTESTFFQWYESEKPDAIIVTEADAPAKWLNARGVRIPKDVGLASLSCPKRRGRQSGIYEYWELQGVRAVNLLIDLLADNELGLHEFPNVSLVDSPWNPGKTVKRRTRRKPAGAGAERV